MYNRSGKTDSIHHHLLDVNLEIATVPELRQKLLYTTLSGWWWCIESVFRMSAGCEEKAAAVFLLEIPEISIESLDKS